MPSTNALNGFSADVPLRKSLYVDFNDSNFDWNSAAFAVTSENSFPDLSMMEPPL